MRKALCVLLCLSLLAIPVFGETPKQTISTAEEFLNLAENCRLDNYSVGLSVELTADIDLGGKDFRGIPIFCGTFNGGGHTISGVSITADGADMGLFRYVAEGAVVSDLHIIGTVTPGGTATNVGGIVGVNAGTVIGCSFSGEIAGADRVGGIAGKNNLTGLLENCSAHGTVYGNHFVGGIAGSSSGVIRSCSNQSLINTTEKQNQVDISNITIDVLTGAESAMTVTDIGGIAGSSSGVIRKCENAAAIGYPHIGYNIGGIAGSQSGFLTECTNSAPVHGRKDVGGIVGQLEPNTTLRFQEDTLQILGGQLDTLGALTNKLKTNADRNATALTTQLTQLDSRVADAKAAVEQLQPQEGAVPDPDKILAAGNSLGTSLQGIGSSLDNISGQAQSGAQALGKDITAISNQVSAIEKTLQNREENLNTGIADVSDADTDEDTTAKLSACINWGAVQGDWNIGGIAGIISFENDLDPESDLDVFGQLSLNNSWNIRAVIRECQSAATLSGKKQNTGGVVGLMALGLVRDCTVSGSITADTGEYTGGIAGRATGGFIRRCDVKATITGSFRTGGIAGVAQEVTDCRSMTRLIGKEATGAILGYAESRGRISGNYYLPVDADPGAIDGISYSDCGIALTQDDFLSLAGLPELFKTNKVVFRFPDGNQQELSIPLGSNLSKEEIPRLPEQSGNTGVWNGLNGANLDNILFDSIFEASYASLPNALASDAVGEKDLPVFLAQGNFGLDSVLAVQPVEFDARMERCLDVWQLTLPDGTEKLRYLLPAGCDPDKVGLRLQNAAGDWREVSFSVDSKYLVFAVQESDIGLQLFLQPVNYTIPIIIACFALLTAALCTVVIIRRKKKK